MGEKCELGLQVIQCLISMVGQHDTNAGVIGGRGRNIVFHLSGGGSSQKQIPEISSDLGIAGNGVKFRVSIVEHLVEWPDYRRGKRYHLSDARILQQII